MNKTIFKLFSNDNISENPNLSEFNEVLPKKCLIKLPKIIFYLEDNTNVCGFFIADEEKIIYYNKFKELLKDGKDPEIHIELGKQLLQKINKT